MRPVMLAEWVERTTDTDWRKLAEDRLKRLLTYDGDAREAVTLLASLQEMDFFDAVAAAMKGSLSDKKTYLMALEEAHNQYIRLLERDNTNDRA